MTQAVATTKQTVAKWINSDRMQQFLRNALPAHVDSKRLTQIYYNVVTAKPELQDCTPISLLKALVFGSQLGLSFDPALKQAWIVPYKKTAQLLVGFKGYEKLVINTGYFDAIDAVPVYEGDSFDYEEGLTPKLVHRPTPRKKGEKVEMIGVYVRGWKGGDIIRFRFYDMQELERHRKASPAERSDRKSPWDDWEMEMYRKTAISIFCKSMPQSDETNTLHRAAGVDELQGLTEDQGIILDGEDIIDGEIVDDEPERTRPKTATDVVKDQVRKAKKAAEKEAKEVAEEDPTADPEAEQAQAEELDAIDALGARFDALKDAGKIEDTDEVWLSGVTAGKNRVTKWADLYGENIKKVADKLDELEKGGE